LGFEITVVRKNDSAFWDVTPYSLTAFRGNSVKVSVSVIVFEEGGRRFLCKGAHFPEDMVLHIYRCRKVKSLFK
jgi:hypothetical protein